MMEPWYELREYIHTYCCGQMLYPGIYSIIFLANVEGKERLDVLVL